MIPLKYATASQEIPLGYFLDSTDGNTEETGLTINNTDIKLWKNGASTLANKNSGGASHISNGIYYATLDDTDTNTLGALIIYVHVAGALAVRVECCVYPAAVYDSLIAGSDYLQTDIVQISGDSTAADNLELDYDGTGYAKANSTIGTCTANTDMRGTDNALLASSAPTNFGDLSISVTTGRVDVGSIEGADATDQIRDSIVDDATRIDASALNTLSGHDPGSTIAAQSDVTGLNNPTVADIADAIWDEAKSGHTGVGSFGEEVQAHSLSTEISALNNISSGDVETACGTALASYDPPTKTELDTAVSTIRGVDSDTLKTISDQMDALNDPTVSEIRAEIDSNSTQLAAIVADTNEIQGKLPTNNIMGSSVKTDKDDEVDSIKTIADKLDTAMELDGAVYRFTLNALEQAPGGVGGGSATIENQVAILAAIAALNDISVDDILAGVIEGTITLQQAHRLFLSVLAGKSSGAGTSEMTFRDTTDATDRVVATLDDDGNRTEITLDVT